MITRRLKQAVAISKSKKKERSRGWRARTISSGVATCSQISDIRGHPRTAEALAKAELARKIAGAIAKRRLTQSAAAELLNIDQPKVSALVRGRLAGFSLDRLVRLLVLLGSDVEIVVKPRARTAGRARVLVA